MYSINMINQINPNDIDNIVNIYHSVGWKNHNSQNVQTIFEKSSHIVLAKYQNNIIGFARALSDDCFNAAIYDVVVHPEFQGKRIAFQMLQLLLNEFEHLSCIHLISTTGNEEFYKKIGFRKLKTGMAIYHKFHLEEEYTI